jgi:hypothetical protein
MALAPELAYIWLIVASRRQAVSGRLVREVSVQGGKTAATQLLADD